MKKVIQSGPSSSSISTEIFTELPNTVDQIIGGPYMATWGATGGAYPSKSKGLHDGIKA
jgi:hypothetical protein